MSEKASDTFNIDIFTEEGMRFSLEEIPKIKMKKMALFQRKAEYIFKDQSGKNITVNVQSFRVVKNFKK
ncbi:hypothetical protein [Fictibacillus sp. NRS-1165]|uniref:hypothetical protein n=1 Tax=Fictibacillus sp. NRS-1165 TaxID=3144463 RepID=UPI003D1B9A65